MLVGYVRVSTADDRQNTNLHGRYEFQKQPDPLNVDAIIEGLLQRPASRVVVHTE
jgi:hypothetical protein